MGVHDGHRDRIRDRFFANGLDAFNEIEALEFLLFYAIQRKDTNPLAHALLDRFGSLDYVLSATEEELCEVPGITKSTAALLMMVPQLARMAEVSRASRIVEISNSRDAIQYLIPRFRYVRDEMLILLCLDGQKRITHTEVLYRGVVNSVNFDVRKVVETAIKRKAVSVIVAHNHPDGPARPSREDDSATQTIFRALLNVGIKLYDHIIIAGDDYASYRQSGALELFRYGY